VNWVNKHGETGLVVPPGDPAALSEALRWMMAHPEERQRMGERARKRFVEQFHIVAVQKAMDDVYHEALGREWVQRAEEEA
jgi:rhamnosyl/mannosyltransferase